MTTLNTPPQSDRPDLSGMQQNVRSRLTQLGSRVRTRIALDAIARGLVTLLALLSVSLLLDYWLELGAAMRVIYWLITLAAAAHFLFHYGIKPLRRRLSPIAIAQAVDLAKHNLGPQQIAPRVATVLDMPAAMGDDGSLSNHMIRDAVTRSYLSLQNEDFQAALDRQHVLRCLGLLLVALLIPAIVGSTMTTMGDNVLSTWAQRWLLLSSESYPRNTLIEVQGLTDDNRLVIPAGEKVTLRAIITTKDGQPVEDPRLILRFQDAKDQTLALTRFDEKDFRTELSPLQNQINATIEAGDQTLRFRIDATARPRLTGLTLEHTHPADPDNTQTIDFNGADGQVALLTLSEVQLNLTANVPIAQARYILDNEDASAGSDTASDEKQANALPPIVRTGPNAFAINWTHESRQRLRLELVSEDAGLVSYPIPVTVGLKTDRKPSVRLRSSGVGQRITPRALIPLDLEARDDYGLRSTAVQLVRVRTGEDGGEKTFDPQIQYEDPDANRRETATKLGLEIDQFGVRPTDLIRVAGLANDDRYVGSQQGQSTQLTFRVVTEKELFREIIARQQQARASFRQAIEEHRDIQLAIAQAQTGRSAAAQSRRFRAAQRTVWKVSRELERSAEEMRLNRLGGDKEDGNQAYESMKSTILEPLTKLHDQTLSTQRDAIEAAGNLNPQGLEKLAEDQQQVVDDMVDLLAKMNRWDELLDAINQLTEVIDQQEQLKDKLDSLEDEQFDDDFFD